MDQSRWQRCIYQRGAETNRFIADFLSETQRRVLLIAGAGFDPRSTIVSSKLAPHVDGRLTALFLREERPNPSPHLIERAEENMRTLTSLVTQSSVAQLQVFAEDGAVIGGRRIAGLVDGIDFSQYTDVIVDFSSLSKGVTFPAVRHVLDLCCRQKSIINVHLMVTDETPTDIEIKEVGSDRAALIAGFEGRWWLSETQDTAKLWVPQLIHDKKQILDRIWRFVSPDDVCPILPFPASDPRRPDLLIEEYGDELQSVWEVEPRDLVYADETNPLDVYRTILRIHAARTRVFREVGGSTVVLSPLGSKVLAIGSLMAAIELDFPVVYVEAVDYQVDFERIAEARTHDGDVVHVWLEGEAYAN